MKTPELLVKIEGRVIASNIAEFRTAIKTALATINREPSTEEEFGQATLDVADLKKAEEAIAATHDAALAQAADVRALLDQLDDTREDVRQERLNLEKQIAAAKKAKLKAIIDGALESLPTVQYERHRKDLEDAAKGKKTLATIEAAVEKKAAEIGEQIAESRQLLDMHREQHGRTLIPDADEMEHWTPGKVKGELARRIERTEAEAKLKEAQEAKRKAEEEAAEERRKAALAAQAQAEVARVKQEAAEEVAKPEPTPTPTPIDPPADETEDEEWARFRAAIIETFATLKPLRLALQHPANQNAALAMAQQFGQALKDAEEWRVKP
jgi:hypothetical protein